MNGPTPGEQHFAVLPLSEVLRRLNQLDHAGTRELRDLVISLGIHLVNCHNKIIHLEARLEQGKPRTENESLYGGEVKLPG